MYQRYDGYKFLSNNGSKIYVCRDTDVIDMCGSIEIDKMLVDAYGIDYVYGGNTVTLTTDMLPSYTYSLCNEPLTIDYGNEIAFTASDYLIDLNSYANRYTYTMSDLADTISYISSATDSFIYNGIINDFYSTTKSYDGIWGHKEEELKKSPELDEFLDSLMVMKP